MIELFIGLLFCYVLYWIGQLLYPDYNHSTIIPEPNNLLKKDCRPGGEEE